MKYQIFNGKDLVPIIDFLYSFKAVRDACNIQESEAM